MGRQPCCDKVGVKKGPWTAEEDKKLMHFILNNGQCCWRTVPKLAGLLRCGKSCRLRWTNYLRPDLKRGLLSESEEKMVIDLHAQLGNKWSRIASHLPGRTDNEIKNHWNTHIKKKLKKMGIDPVTHMPFSTTAASDQPNMVLTTTTTTNEPIYQQDIDVVPGSMVIEYPMDQYSTITKTEQEVDDNNINNNMEALMINNGFCIDEVPIIGPQEMIVTTTSESTTPSSSSSSSISNNNMDNILQDQFQVMPSFNDWTCHQSNMDNMSFSWDDDFSNCLDFLLSDERDMPVAHSSVSMQSN